MSGRTNAKVKREAFGPADWINLLAFFKTVQSAYLTFRFRDWTDYYAGGTVDSRGSFVATTPNVFAKGNGTQTVFQLGKTYSTQFGEIMLPVTRTIRRPVSGTVNIYVGATLGSMTLQTSGVTVDYDTGKITFTTAPANTYLIGWDGLFDIPMRFTKPELMAQVIVGQALEWSEIEMIEVYE